MNTLVLIPARGGSKGIPGKNIKPLGGKPLIYWTIDVARQLTSDEHICVSTDDPEIISVVEAYGLKVPFKRPLELATDISPTRDTILHALNEFEKKGIFYQSIMLLQPTSPFRKLSDVKECVEIYNSDLDMVVSVCESKANPYFNLFEENGSGYLQLSKPSAATRRQDCPRVFEYTGSIYIINSRSVKNTGLKDFSKVRKKVTDKFSAVDLDLPEDWLFAEFVIEKGLFTP